MAGKLGLAARSQVNPDLPPFFFSSFFSFVLDIHALPAIMGSVRQINLI